MSINKVILLGNVGIEPKVTYFEGGNCVAQVRLATTDRAYTLANGTQVPERTEWHNLVFRGRIAETVDKYVHKGDKLYVEGRLRYNITEDKRGQRATVVDILVENMEMLTPKSQNGSNDKAAPAPQAAPAVHEDSPF